jgi:hypothetical protein
MNDKPPSMTNEQALPVKQKLRWVRAIRALGWLAMIAGWVLVWRGHGAWGCVLVALFAVIRLMTARPSATPVKAVSPAPEVFAAAASAAHPFDPWQDDKDESPPSPVAAPMPEDADRHSDSASRWRRLVWLSYGNAFLHGHADLDDWYRHSLTWKAVCSFRDGTDRRLIASDGFEWLSGLRQRGALRLSLDVAGAAPALDGIERWDSQTLTCHFADRRERWRMGEESSEALRQAEAMPWEQRQQAFPMWGRGSYLPDVDAYLRIEVLQGTEPEVPIDWRQAHKAVEAALRQAGPLGYEHAMGTADAGLFYRDVHGEDPAWSRFPVLPDDPALFMPHRLLNDLLRRKSAWDNATHPKNEGSLYAMAGTDEALREIEAHGELLSALIGRVQRLAGSETRWKPRPRPPL